MPRFRVRLEDPNSDEFRVVNLTAADEDEARGRCEAREWRYVDFQLDDGRLAELEAKEEAGELTHPGKEFGALHLHRQAEPYKVVAVAKRGELFGDRKVPKGGG